MGKLYQVRCPKCNNKTDFYRYGKDVHGHQKYQCKKCWHQFVPGGPTKLRPPSLCLEQPYSGAMRRPEAIQKA